MKTTIATLGAFLLAGAAFAQTAPAEAPAQATMPDSSTPPAVAKAAAAHEKRTMNADAGDAKAGPERSKRAGKAKGKAGKNARPTPTPTPAPAPTPTPGQISKQPTTAALMPARAAG